MGDRPEYRWSDPTSVEYQAGPTNDGNGWTTVASIDGHWAHCDFSFAGSQLYLGRPWRLLARTGSVWSIVGSGVIGAPPLFAANAGDRSGILCAMRGHPADAFLAEVSNGVFPVVVPPALWRLHVWGRESDASSPAGGGAPPVLWTPRHSVGTVPVYIASAVPCLCNCAFARNDSGPGRWFQIHDLAVAPNLGDYPILPGIPIPDGAPASISCDAMQLLVGCCLVSSLTAPTYTPDPRGGLDMGALVQ